MRLTGDDLDEWARRRAAEGELPELVRRLIQATLDQRDLLRLDLPADGGVTKPGADGWVVTTVENTYVPRGTSIWEIGRNKDFKEKAQADYRNRTHERPPPGITLADATFVFVTPHRWHGCREQEQKWRDEGLWKDVRIHDADALAAWLQKAPAVEVWLAELLGRPGPLQSLERHWEEWSLATDPPLSEGLVLAGREHERERFLSWLTQRSSVLSMQAADAAEAVAFCWAALQHMPREQRDAWLARSVVVSGDDQLHRTALLKSRPLLLLARDCSIQLARQLARPAEGKAGHHVLLATDSRERGETLVLSQLDPPRAQVELERMGLPVELARKLVLQTRGKLGVSLAEIRSKLGGFDQALPEELAPLVLVGSWTDSEEDVQAVCEIVDGGPEHLRALERRHGGLQTSPLVCDGDRWRWVSHRDAWWQLGRRLLPKELEAFVKVFVRVFSGEGFNGSTQLKRGLLAGLMLLATESDTLPSSYDTQIPDRAVDCLLRSRTILEQWSGLGEALATLAEAVPDRFLQHAQRVIPSGIDGAVPAELIAALEVLAWREDYLATVTELLARVAEAGDSTDNPALDTLRDIYRPWQPQTAASREVRTASLDALTKRYPRVAVELLLALLPASLNSFSVTTRRPRLRDWAKAADVEVAPEDVHAVFVHAWDKLLELACSDPRHWLAILPKLDRLSHDHHRLAAIDALAELDASKLDSGQQKALWEQLRALIHHDRRYAGRDDGQWLIPEEQLTRLEVVYDRLTPSDPRESLAWLFETSPALLHPPSLFRSSEFFAEFAAILSNEHQAAARRLSAGLSNDEIVEFSGHVANPIELGYVLGCLEPEGRAQELLRASTTADHAGSRALRTGLGKALAEHGVSPGHISLPDSCQADVLLGYPHDADTWDLVESLGAGVAQEYWRHFGYLFPHEPKNLERVVRALLRVDRAWAAIEAAAAARVMNTASLDDSLIVELLDAAHRTNPEAEGLSRSASYNVHKLLDQLRKAAPRWREELRRLEWALLPMFDFRRHHPRVLYEALAGEPEYFIAMMKLAYPQRTGDSEERLEAPRARKLLRHWNLLPGQQPGGHVDSERLRDWLRMVRAELRSCAPAAEVDRRLGEVLATSPEGTDGRWPHEAVREVLEEIESPEHIEGGMFVGRRDHLSLQIDFVDPARDRARVDKLHQDAKAMRPRWPSAARVVELLARSSADDARMWDDLLRRELEWTEPVTTAHRVEAFLTELQRHGRYIFDYAELMKAVGYQGDLLRVLSELSSVAAISEDAYVIVKPEYHDIGAPPPSWYIHELMTREDRSYCIGLLSAAALSGAAPQQPQITQVLVDRPRDRAKIGAHVIEFITRSRPQEFITRPVNTYTGHMLVATPEATVFDLAEFAEACGGRAAVVDVYEDLGEEIDVDAMVAIASAYPSAVVIEASAMLDDAGHGELAQALRRPPSQRALGVR